MAPPVDTRPPPASAPSTHSRWDRPDAPSKRLNVLAGILTALFVGVVGGCTLSMAFAKAMIIAFAVSVGVIITVALFYFIREVLWEHMS